MVSNSLKSFNIEELRQALERMDKMTITELEELSKQINIILSGENNVNFKSLNSIDVNRYNEENDNVIRIKEWLVGALNIVMEMISIRNEEIQIYSSLKTLNQMGNNPKLISSQDEAMDLATDFVGPCKIALSLKGNNNICIRMISEDKKRQVKYIVESNHSKYKGKRHYNFEIIDERYLSNLNKELDFEVKSNYHLFVDYSSSNQQKDGKVK